MTHYVLLKFKPGSDLDAIEKTIRKTYEELDKTLSFLNNAKVYRCCVERDSNADIMAKVDLDKKEQLQDYLTHPLHIKMMNTFNDVLASRASFDHE